MKGNEPLPLVCSCLKKPLLLAEAQGHGGVMRALWLPEWSADFFLLFHPCSLQRYAMRLPIVLSLLFALVSGATAAIDSGGGSAVLRDSTNHSSIGAPMATSERTTVQRQRRFRRHHEPYGVSRRDRSASGTSVFRPSSRVESRTLVLTLPTFAGRCYRVWGTSNFRGSWTQHDTISGNGSSVAWEYLMSQSATGRYFLKIEILIPTN
jgi:hypothetical protein